MRRESFLCIAALFPLVFAAFLGGCGSGKKEGATQPLAQATQVGSESCVNTCHAATVDVTGDVIAATWSSPLNTHTQDGNVQCENCHGPASLHWGVGPIPYPNPQPAQCEVCHPDQNTFNTTAHNNQNEVPNSTFSQFTPPVAPGVAAPSSSQHVQECSVCHNSSQRFVFNSLGTLTMPNPNNLPNPVVTCASCHDAHFTESKQAIAQQNASVPYPNFRFYFQNMSTAQVNPVSGALINPRAQVTPGTLLSARQQGFIFQPNGAVMPAAGVAPGTTTAPNFAKVVGRNNEIKPDLLCAACHTQGTYLYSQTATHQTGVYTQWTNSAHAERNDPAWAEFSANPTTYVNPNTGLNYTAADAGHQSIWPFNMALNTVGATATLTRNAGVPTSTGGINNNFACYKCHNGITSIDYQEDVQGTPDASVVWGDATATCITCHDPHSNSTGLTNNVRRPVVMTRYTFSSAAPAAFQPFAGNVFLDRNPVPAQAENANSVICIFCHQGRESGYTLFGTRLSTGTVPTSSFFNNHYLGTAAMIWGVNGYEFPNGGLPSYSVNASHQATNCAGCHMDNPTSDNQTAGHTWVVNPNNCTTCHSTIVNPPVTAASLADPNGFLATTRVTGDTNNYTGDSDGATISISTTIMRLEQKLIGLLANQGIFYDDTTYPYFFNVNITVPDGTANNHSNANAFTTWSEPQLKAAFNLSYVIKGLPSAGGSTTYATIPGTITTGTPVRVPNTSSTLVPNNSAAVHNYKYNIELLQDSIANLSGQGANVFQPGGLLAGAVRPSTSTDRPATSYNPGGINLPYPNFQ